MTVNIFEGIISKQEAEDIIAISGNLLHEVPERTGFFEDSHNRDVIGEEEAINKNRLSGMSDELAIASAKISGTMHKIRLFAENFYQKSLPYAEGGFVKLATGASNGLHSDMYKNNGDSWDDETNRDVKFNHSAILYLSDYKKDFTGGELIFPQQKLTIEPKIGKLVLFHGDRKHFHMVNKVLSGERYSVVLFMGDTL